MFLVKGIIYILIFSSSTYIGILISKQYSNRVKELKHLKSALNMLKTKIRYTNEPLYNIFEEIANASNGNISNLFSNVCKKLKDNSASVAWENSVDTVTLSIKREDRQVIRSMGKMLGKTDIDGQLSEIELTENFLETQIIDAENEKSKNEKLYRTLGMVTGVGIIVILI